MFLETELGWIFHHQHLISFKKIIHKFSASDIASEQLPHKWTLKFVESVKV